MGPSVTQVEAFLRIADTGRAAPPGGTRQAGWQAVRRFEESLGLRPGALVTASGALTPTGTRLLPEARAVVEAVERLAAASKPSVGLGCYPSHVPIFVEVRKALQSARRPDALAGWDITLRATSDAARATRGASLLAALHAGSCDLAIVPEAPPRLGITSLGLYDWRLRAVGDVAFRSPQLDSIRVEHLMEHPLAMAPRGHASRDLLDDVSVRLRPTLETDSSEALVSLGLAGEAVAIVPDDSLAMLRLGDDRLQHPVISTARRRVLGGRFEVARRSDDTRPATLAAAQLVAEASRRLYPQGPVSRRSSRR